MMSDFDKDGTGKISLDDFTAISRSLVLLRGIEHHCIAYIHVSGF